MTVWRPAAFPVAMLRALSSKNTCAMDKSDNKVVSRSPQIDAMKNQSLVSLVDRTTYRPLGVKVCDLYDSFHGFQGRLAQDRPSRRS
jgi:hypothetical protein